MSVSIVDNRLAHLGWDSSIAATASEPDRSDDSHHQAVASLR